MLAQTLKKPDLTFKNFPFKGQSTVSRVKTAI